MKVKTLKTNRNEIFVVPLGDAHIGSKAFNKQSEEKLKGYINWIRKTPNAYTVLMGDWLNCAAMSGASSPFEQNMTLQEQVNYAVKLLTPIKDKILGAITGNHEARLENYAGYNPTISLCDRLDTFYFGYDGIVIFRLGCHTKNKGSPRASFSGYFHHSTGGGSTIGGKLNRVDKLRQVVCNADFYCVEGNTMIKTIDGYFPIKDIRIGDSVLTKEGEYRKVKRIFRRKSDTITVKTRGSFQNLVVTPEHPVWTQEIKRKRTSKGTKYLPIGNSRWKNAGDIKIGDFVAIAKEELPTLPNPLIMGQRLDEELAYFIGLYLAEGNIGKNKINISLNDETEDHLKEGVRKIARRFGVGITEAVHKGTKSYQAHINSKRLMTYFLQFGRTSHSKRIPTEYMYLSDSLTKAMLDGLFDGDGCKRKNREILELATVSKEMAYQAGFLLNRLGFNSNINYDRKKYTISYSLKDKLIRRYKDKEFTYVEVIGNTKYKKSLEVYNLEVEDSNTYTANGIVVHNCGGHNHLLGCVHTSIFRINETTEKVEQLRQMIVDTGGFLSYEGSYVNKKQMPPVKLGAPKIRLLIKRKKTNGKETISRDIHVSL